MASASASILPSLFLSGNKNIFKNLRKLPASTVKGRQRRAPVVAKALGDSSDSSSQSIVKYVQNAPLSQFGHLAISLRPSTSFLLSQVLLSSLEYCSLGGLYIGTSYSNLTGKSYREILRIRSQIYSAGERLQGSNQAGSSEARFKFWNFHKNVLLFLCMGFVDNNVLLRRCIALDRTCQ
ncbi:hypothetical protein COCNU_14G003740 [Cocos nucifera]|uniref:Uncharacterized protein n=1 Tax=Cocos nucifera TaxID=13894 RepID=A0A8K0IUE1_COCNU|nr:hypothetical protein COCNU_14G003740 [Cocos nucifera]